jgi:CRP-like cAMP-binding protein
VELLGSIYPFHRKAGLDYAMLNLVYENLEIAEYSEGEVIYAIEQQAKSLYIVFSGEIHLLKNTQEGEEVIVRLSSGDFFGYEVLEDAQYRAKAVAVTSVVVLVLAREALIRLASQIREFNLGLRLMYDSYRLAQRVHLEWITPDEVIYFIGRATHGLSFSCVFLPHCWQWDSLCH